MALRVFAITFLLLLLIVTARADQLVLVDSQSGNSLAVDTRTGTWIYTDQAGSSSTGTGGRITRPSATLVIFERKLTAKEPGIRAIFNRNTGKGQALILASRQFEILNGLWIVAEIAAPIPTTTPKQIGRRKA